MATKPLVSINMDAGLEVFMAVAGQCGAACAWQAKTDSVRVTIVARLGVCISFLPLNLETRDSGETCHEKSRAFAGWSIFPLRCPVLR